MTSCSALLYSVSVMLVKLLKRFVFGVEHAGAAGRAAQWSATRQSEELHLPVNQSHPLVP